MIPAQAVQEGGGGGEGVEEEGLGERGGGGEDGGGSDGDRIASLAPVSSSRLLASPPRELLDAGSNILAMQREEWKKKQRVHGETLLL